MSDCTIYPPKNIHPSRPPARRSERAQVIVLVVLSFIGLLAFVGLVTDVGSIYVTYSQLKRAVDAAAVAAANNIKSAAISDAQRRVNITEAAREMLNLHQVTNITLLEVYLCGDTGSPADFVAMCPGPGEPPRKLAYVQATQNVPVYFLGLVGVNSFPLTLSAVGEAATLDIILVFDTSESMGLANLGGQSPDDFNPSGCNVANNCQPLRQAKDAAKELLRNLFNGYDQVGIITFDFQAHVIPIGGVNMSTNIGDDDGDNDGDAFAAIDYLVRLHDDPPAGRVPWYRHRFTYPNSSNRLNFVDPEDRNGDGSDADGGAYACTDTLKWGADDYIPETGPDLYDDASQMTPNGSEYIKLPEDQWIFCDNDSLRDVFDWNQNGDFTDDGSYDFPPYNPTLYVGLEERALASTCTGCGIRMAAQTLLSAGRPNGVWVMVLLSDGAANMSDLPSLQPSAIPATFYYGACGSSPTNSFWEDKCFDYNNQSGFHGSPGRYCIDTDSSECPFGTTHTTTSKPYSAEDYAFDMVDAAGLMFSDNPDEPPGANIVMYSIGLGSGVSHGETLLRYMANVGSDGDRVTDPCNGIATFNNCGNYYFAPNASYLAQIFETIAGNIFTKISR